MLLVAPAFAGGAFAAPVPGAPIYIGDLVPFAPTGATRRPDARYRGGCGRGDGVVAELVSWRAAFAVVAAVALVLAALMVRLPEPGGRTASRIRTAVAFRAGCGRCSCSRSPPARASCWSAS